MSVLELRFVCTKIYAYTSRRESFGEPFHKHKLSDNLVWRNRDDGFVRFQRLPQSLILRRLAPKAIEDTKLKSGQKPHRPAAPIKYLKTASLSLELLNVIPMSSHQLLCIVSYHCDARCKRLDRPSIIPL